MLLSNFDKLLREKLLVSKLEPAFVLITSK